MATTAVTCCAFDDPRLGALLDRAHGEHLRRYPELGGALRGRLDPAVCFLLAGAGQAPALGCCGVQPLSAPGVAAPAYELKRMYVDPAARRAGVGRLLLAAAERLAAGRGARWMYLETGVRHTAAVPLYERAGYRRVPPYPPYLDDPFALCYAKSLADGRS